MTDKLAKRVNESREIAEENIAAKMSANNKANQQQLASMMLGAVAAVGHIARSLNADTIKGLQRMRDEKLFESFGYSRFDDFLDEYQFSPMSYRQFNDREKLLLQEGDDVFDALNTLKLSHRQRKMLGAGHVQVDGEMVIVVTQTLDGEDKVEEIELADRQRLLQTLSALADQNVALNTKANRQQEKIERDEREIESLQKKIDAGTGGTMATAHFEIWMRAITPLNQLADFAKKDLTLVEKEAHGETYLRSFGVALARLATAYGIQNFVVGFDDEPEARSKPYGEMEDDEIKNHVAKKLKNFKGDDETNEFSSIIKDINDEELEEMM